MMRPYVVEAANLGEAFPTLTVVLVVGVVAAVLVAVGVFWRLRSSGHRKQALSRNLNKKSAA